LQGGEKQEMINLNSKINIKIVEKVDDADKKLASFEWQFLNYSLGIKDIDLIKELGIETYAELECIDERAAAQTVLTGRIRMEYGYPGGGFDFLTKQDIRELLSTHNGLIVLDPHRSCGWGKLRLKYYVKTDLEKVKTYIKDSFSDNNFLNSVLRSSKLQKQYNFRKDFDQAYEDAFHKGEKLSFVNEVHEELIDLAFVFGKLKELKNEFENEAKKLNLRNSEVRLNPDMLFDQPSHHIASGAVINLTKRKLVHRFSLENVYEEAFFADVDLDRTKSVMSLIFSILESDHSATKDKGHDVFVVCNNSQLEKIKKVMESFKDNPENINTSKNIFIHVVEDDEKVKTKEQILSIVR